MSHQVLVRVPRELREEILLGHVGVVSKPVLDHVICKCLENFLSLGVIKAEVIVQIGFLALFLLVVDLYHQIVGDP